MKGLFREKQSRTEERLEERLLNEAKRIAREIAGAQRAAKKAERLEGRVMKAGNECFLLFCDILHKK